MAAEETLVGTPTSEGSVSPRYASYHPEITKL
jgi:hypothetical protein